MDHSLPYRLTPRSRSISVNSWDYSKISSDLHRCIHSDCADCSSTLPAQLVRTRTREIPTGQRDKTETRQMHENHVLRFKVQLAIPRSAHYPRLSINFTLTVTVRSSWNTASRSLLELRNFALFRTGFFKVYLVCTVEIMILSISGITLWSPRTPRHLDRWSFEVISSTFAK